MPIAQVQRGAIDPEKMWLARKHPDRWLEGGVLIQPEDRREGNAIAFRPTPLQRVALDFVRRNKHSIIIKHRQAKMSTLIAMLLLHRVMYTPSMKGLLIGNAEDTTEVLFDRIRFAYRNMPHGITPKAQIENTEHIQWPAFNEIRAITGGGDNPAIGNSPDAYMVTEFGVFKKQSLFTESFFPAIAKRPGTWGVIETTPGMANTPLHKMWLEAIAGNSQLKPLFLAWWKDETCRMKPPEGWRPDQEGLKLLNEHPGMTPEHLWFRETMIKSYFQEGGDTQFRAKYPFHELDGWRLSHGRPAVPREPLEILFKTAKNCIDGVETFYEEPEEGEKYLVTCDPNSYGASGDPGSLKVWRRYDRKEVWAFHGREDPGLMGRRAVKIAEKYNNATLMVENNKAECIAAVRALGYEHLYWEDEHHPGWRATETTKGEAVEAMVEMIREEEIGIVSKPTITQLLQWDGNTAKRISNGNGTKHHFDQVTTCYMAAWYFRKRPLATRYVKPKPEVRKSRLADQYAAYLLGDGSEIPANLLLALTEERKRHKARNVFGGPGGVPRAAQRGG